MVAFDYPGRGLINCIIKPQDLNTRKLLQQKLQDLNTRKLLEQQPKETNPNIAETSDNDILGIVRRLEVMVWNLNQIKN